MQMGTNEHSRSGRLRTQNQRQAAMAVFTEEVAPRWISQCENLFGVNLSGLRIRFWDQLSDHSNIEFRTLARASQTEIALCPKLVNQCSGDFAIARLVLAHELAHVAQSRTSRRSVHWKPTAADDALEAEAGLAAVLAMKNCTLRYSTG